MTTIDAPPTRAYVPAIPEFMPLFGSVLVMITIPEPELAPGLREMRLGMKLPPDPADVAFQVLQASVGVQAELSTVVVKNLVSDKLPRSNPFGFDFAVAQGGPEEAEIACRAALEDLQEDISRGVDDAFGVSVQDVSEFVKPPSGWGVAQGVLYPRAACAEALSLNDARLAEDLSKALGDSPFSVLIQGEGDDVERWTQGTKGVQEYLESVCAMYAHALVPDLAAVKKRSEQLCDYMRESRTAGLIQAQEGESSLQQVVLWGSQNCYTSAQCDSPHERSAVLYRTQCGNCDDDHYLILGGVMLSVGTEEKDFYRDDNRIQDPVDVLARAGAPPKVLTQLSEEQGNDVGWLISRNLIPAAVPVLQPVSPHLRDCLVSTLLGTMVKS